MATMNDQMTQNALEARIMRRVYVSWFARKVRTSRLVRLVSLAGLMSITLTRVSVTQVLENASKMSINSHIMGYSDYLAYAFMHTETIVQVLFAGSIGLLTLFMLDAGKGFQTLVKRTVGGK
jgi:hypothetical protein